MSKAKLNSIVEKHIEASTEFWAGKPKLSLSELNAIESYAKKKSAVLKEFFSLENNVNELDTMFKAAVKK